MFGVLLGLSLSDGYLKKSFKFNVVSKNLSDNVFDILVKFGFSPRRYVHKRSKWGWKDLYMISLIRGESKQLLEILDKSIGKIDGEMHYQKLKYGSTEI